ncbi:VMA21-like domain protein [Ancylostoma caninum]|uniref:VMA21-like domain protein n=1 Tax=Ancylostoma caninum TaxID=29170 RepID=A0A368FP10_ANCCA|nr:VMA21-like domain protein [Ancylostoma caninum]
MSDEYGVVRGGSSSSISTVDSFENVTGPTSSESGGSRESPIVNEDSKPVENPEQAIPSEINDADTVEDACSNEPFYTNVHSRRAISILIKFSAAMFVLPLLTMFTMYHYVFRDYFHLPPDQAMLYAGFCGIAVVIIIVIVFIYVAYRDEQEEEKIEKLAKKSE